MRDHLVPTLGPLTLLALLACGCGEASGKLLGGQLPGRDITSWEGEIDEKTASSLRVGRCGDGVAQVELIDDMEDGNTTLAKIAGRTQGWYTFNDETVGGEQLPEEPFEAAQLDSPRGSSQYAIHTWGTGFTEYWGAGVGFDFVYRATYDATHYAGLGFWTRTSSSELAQVMRMNVSDRNTSQYDHVCDVDCQDNPLAPKKYVENKVCDENRKACFDDFGADFSGKLSTRWTFVKFIWPALKTANWSERNLTSLLTSALHGVSFQAGKAAAFDFWIDDVYFLCPIAK